MLGIVSQRKKYFYEARAVALEEHELGEVVQLPEYAALCYNISL